MSHTLHIYSWGKESRRNSTTTRSNGFYWQRETRQKGNDSYMELVGNATTIASNERRIPMKWGLLRSEKVAEPVERRHIVMQHATNRERH